MRLRRSTAPAGLLLAAEDETRLEGLGAELASLGPRDACRTVAPEALLTELAEAKAPPRAVLLAAESQDAAEPARMDRLAGLVGSVSAAGVPVILLVRDLPPAAMHRLMRAGATDFAPVPLPIGALAESLARLVAKEAEAAPAPASRPRDGLVHAVYGVAGGVGATTYAVNLAWEIATFAKKTDLKVCLLDLDLQYGSVATYLDLERRDAVFELLSDMENADSQGLRSAMLEAGDRLSVLTAPADALPLDMLSPTSVQRLLRLASDSFDVVVADMPRTLTLWTETVLQASQRFHVVLESDIRSAHNMLRLQRTLKAEELPVDKIDAILNRAPGFGDFAGRARVKKMAETLGMEYSLTLPEGGRAVLQACDAGTPLEQAVSGNALRKEIRKAAKSIYDEVQASRIALA